MTEPPSAGRAERLADLPGGEWMNRKNAKNPWAEDTLSLDEP